MNRVLILSGKVASEHNMTEMNRDLKLMLEATGEFQVRATEEFNGATERTLEGYDMILLNYDGKDKPTDRYQTLEPGAEKVFFDFVRKGGGLYIHHSSCWLEDGLPEEYYKLWGYYLTMPYSRKVPQDDFCVHPVGNDPIVRGLSRQILAPVMIFSPASRNAAAQNQRLSLQPLTILMPTVFRAGRQSITP